MRVSALGRVLVPDASSALHSAPGLSEADAQARLKSEGYNELPRPERRTPLRIVLEVLREPMLALLHRRRPDLSCCSGI